MSERQYICIDLKSFYASVECVERGLDPMTTDLVVADPERSEKTICLAVSPSLKAKGVRNRCRVFEIPKGMKYIMACPRMKLYIEYSANIYAIYLRFFSKEDIHVYSIDEAFIDVTNYLDFYGMDACGLAERVRDEVMAETGIPATCGIGTNLYLAKISLDITAKHSPNFLGYLDERSYRNELWNHKPLTDFWRIGPGTQRRLRSLGIETMGQLAMYRETDMLYKVFGVDAEILIDHAWGIEPVTISDIKAYKSKSRSLSNGQVLPRGYCYSDALIVVKEMAEALSLDLVKKHLVTDSVNIVVVYEKDEEGRTWGSKGSHRLPFYTNSQMQITACIVSFFDREVDHGRLVRRIMLCCGNVIEEGHEQLDLFSDAEEDRREHIRQDAILSVKSRFGKNSLLKGIDLMPNATQRDRNEQIGGHKSGE
ncbi:MAG: DNA repair protein [Coriobacteriales bacterium]|jgi:DNA polymerase V